MGAGNKTLDATLLTGSGARVRKGGVAGEAISAGQAVYHDPTTTRYKLAIGTSSAAADVSGFARHTAAAGQPLEVIYEGEITGLTSLSQGKVYVLSDDSAGDVMPVDDIGAGDYVTVVGVATSTTKLKVGIIASGVTASAAVT